MAKCRLVANPGSGETATLTAILKRHAIPNELQVIDNMPHGFMQFIESEGCQLARERMIDFLRGPCRGDS